MVTAARAGPWVVAGVKVAEAGGITAVGMADAMVMVAVVAKTDLVFAMIAAAAAQVPRMESVDLRRSS